MEYHVWEEGESFSHASTVNAGSAYEAALTFLQEEWHERREYPADVSVWVRRSDLPWDGVEDPCWGADSFVGVIPTEGSEDPITVT